MSNSSPPPKYRFRFLQFFLLFLITECPYIDLLVWVLYFLISPRLYLKWRWNSGIYENVTLTNTNAIFFFLVLLISSKLYWIEFYSQGPRKGRGWEGGGAGPPHFSKKKKLRNTHFLIKGIFDGIRILDWRTSPEHPNLWLVRFDPLSLWQASKWLSLQNYT